MAISMNLIGTVHFSNYYCLVNSRLPSGINLELACYCSNQNTPVPVLHPCAFNSFPFEKKTTVCTYDVIQLPYVCAARVLVC
jgi:hypothetical protein